MKINKKPLLAMVCGPILLCAAVCQTAHANVVMVETNTAVLADSQGANTGPEALQVGYSVTEDTPDDIFTYTYNIFNPAGDVLLNGGGPEKVDFFAVDFNTTTPGSYFDQTGGTFGGANPTGLFWFLKTPEVFAGNYSGALSFESLIGPTMGNGSASDGNPPSPWDSSPDGSQLPVPAPDSASTMTLLGGVMMLLPFGKRIARK
jgi:hypothetical protein